MSPCRNYWHLNNLNDGENSSQTGEGNVGANLNTAGVLREIAQQVMVEITRNVEGRNRYVNTEGCMFEQFNRLHPPKFEGKADPAAVENWVQDIEEMLCLQRYTKKVLFAVFKLTGVAKH